MYLDKVLFNSNSLTTPHQSYTDVSIFGNTELAILSQALLSSYRICIYEGKERIETIIRGWFPTDPLKKSEPKFDLHERRRHTQRPMAGGLRSLLA